MDPSSLMLVNMTIASADVCRVNKCENNCSCLTLIAPPYIEILHSFWNNFHWSLHSLGVVQLWCSFSFRPPLGYVWTHRTLFVTFNMIQYIMFAWINTQWYRFALLPICVFSTKLASSFFILIWNLKFVLVESNYFWCDLQIRIMNVVKL